MFVLRDIPCLLIRLLMKPPYIAKTQEDVLQFRKVQEDMRILYHHLISLLSWGGGPKSKWDRGKAAGPSNESECL